MHNPRMRLLLALALVACSPNAPKNARVAGEAEPEADVQQTFMTPTGNIGCVYTPAGGTEVYRTRDGRAELACDRVEPAYVRVILSERGAAERIDNVGDASCCAGETIAYGQRWQAGPFLCDVSEAGVSCANAEGRGFTLSRATIEVR